jgi:transposase
MVKCSKAEVRRLKTALRWKIPAAQRERIQMVLLRESGMTQGAIAAALGVSLSTVNRAHMAYDQGGIKALAPKPNGGRKHENMTLAEEKALLARFAKAAGAGEMLNIHDLKAAYEKAIGHATSDSTVYNLLHRHGWRKLMPRPFHSKRDLTGRLWGSQPNIRRPSVALDPRGKEIRVQGAISVRPTRKPRNEVPMRSCRGWPSGGTADRYSRHRRGRHGFCNRRWSTPNRLWVLPCNSRDSNPAPTAIRCPPYRRGRTHWASGEVCRLSHWLPQAPWRCGPPYQPRPCVRGRQLPRHSPG